MQTKYLKIKMVERNVYNYNKYLLTYIISGLVGSKAA